MDYFKDIYLKRVNRYGLNYQARIQSQREEVFERLLLKSIYRVDFIYNNEEIPGTLERFKQDHTETLQYLLTRVSVNIPDGTILMIPNKDGIKQPWMVYYLEDIKASGYNRYIVLKMTHYLTWLARDGQYYSSWAYMYGQEDNMIKDEICSRSRMDSLYAENLKSSFFVLPTHEKIKKEVYLEVGEGELQESYVVTGYDIQSAPGIEFVTVDPTYKYDLTPAPIKTEDSNEEDFFWLEGGIE